MVIIIHEAVSQCNDAASRFYTEPTTRIVSFSLCHQYPQPTQTIIFSYINYKYFAANYKLSLFVEKKERHEKTDRKRRRNHEFLLG